MTDTGFFRLLIRAIGIFLLCRGIPSLVQTSSQMVTMVATSAGIGAGMNGYLWSIGGTIAGEALSAGLGLYLLFGGE